METLKFFQNTKVDKNSHIPRHYQVKEKIKEVIAIGALKKGDPLPSERKLCQLLQVSRITIRRALADLEKEQIIERVWGKGIFVLNPPDNTKKIKKIGITIWASETPYHPATMETLRGIADVLDNSRYNPEVIFINEQQIKNGNYLNNLSSDIIECIIVTVQEIPEEHLQIIKNRMRNVIFYNLNVPETENLVVMDYRKASFEICQFLCNLGHKKIALLNGPAAFMVSKEVLKGYSESLKKTGLEIISELIKNGYYSTDNGYKLTKQLLQQKIKPTAIIAGDDFMAMGVLKAIKEQGLSCPDDISVTSFNDFPFTEFTQPPLTSYHFDFYNIGKTLAEQAVKLVSGQPINKIILTGKLKIRASTAPPTTEKGGERK